MFKTFIFLKKDVTIETTSKSVSEADCLTKASNGAFLMLFFPLVTCLKHQFLYYFASKFCPGI